MNQSKILQGVIGLAAIAITGWLLLQWWPSDDSSLSSLDSESGEQSTHIHLTAGKASVAGIRTEPVKRQTLEITRTVPARFAYDNRHHVAVRTPADGVLDILLVKPGDVVGAGQSLAILRSPAIGKARSEVLRRQADLDLLEARRSQMANIQKGVSDLIASLQAGNPPDVIQRQLSDATLGEYRGQLLANYSKLQLASQLSEAASGSGGAISGRIVQERVSEQQQARAELEGAVEQAIFETDQALRSAASDVDTARRNLSIAQTGTGHAARRPGGKLSSVDDLAQRIGADAPRDSVSHRGNGRTDELLGDRTRHERRRVVHRGRYLPAVGRSRYSRQ